MLYFAVQAFACCVFRLDGGTGGVVFAVWQSQINQTYWSVTQKVVELSSSLNFSSTYFICLTLPSGKHRPLLFSIGKQKERVGKGGKGWEKVAKEDNTKREKRKTCKTRKRIQNIRKA